MTSHDIASHRIASHRIASHRIASHRIASHRITANLVVIADIPRPINSHVSPPLVTTHTTVRYSDARHGVQCACML
jgi:hypothetical protein